MRLELGEEKANGDEGAQLPNPGQRRQRALCNRRPVAEGLSQAWLRGGEAGRGELSLALWSLGQLDKRKVSGEE